MQTDYVTASLHTQRSERLCGKRSLLGSQVAHARVAAACASLIRLPSTNQREYGRGIASMKAKIEETSEVLYFHAAAVRTSPLRPRHASLDSSRWARGNAQIGGLVSISLTVRRFPLPTILHAAACIFRGNVWRAGTAPRILGRAEEGGVHHQRGMRPMGDRCATAA